MEKFISHTEDLPMKFVIAGYSDKMVYHQYDRYNDELSAGKNLTVEAAKKIFRFVNSNQIENINHVFRDLIPANVVQFFTDEKFVVWHTPGHMENLFFQTAADIKDGMYWVPNMLWVLRESQLRVFALNGKPESLDDKVYNAPFFNVDQKGLVCMGSAKFKSQSFFYDDIIAKVEMAFWNSKFTHSSRNDLLNTNYTEYMKSIEGIDFNQKMIKDYDALLIDSKRTIRDIITS